MLTVLSVCAYLFVGQTPTAPELVTLKFQPPVGTSYKYKMSMGMSMSGFGGSEPMEIKTDVDVDMKALSRTGDVTAMETRTGTAKVTTPEGSPLAGKTEEMEQTMSSKVIQSQIDGRYHMTGVKGSGMDEMFGNMNTMTFPDHPVGTGDTWSSSMDLGKMLSGSLGAAGAGATVTGVVPIKFVLKNIAHRDGKTIVDIQMDMKGSPTLELGGQSMTINMKETGTFQVDAATGVTVGMHISTDSTMSFGGMEMTQHLTQSLVGR